MKYLKFLISPLFMGVLFVVFAGSMAVATFIENDFGSQAAKGMVYNSRWFELVFLLLAVNLIGRMVVLKLYTRSKLPVFIFHLAFVIMIAGAGITRYFGWEGSIHIREGEEQNVCFSGEKYISYSVKDLDGNITESNSEVYSMSSVTADNYKKTLKINSNKYDLALARILPNAAEVISEAPDGEPIISLLITKDMISSENVILRKGETVTSNGITIGFASAQPAELNISVTPEGFFMTSSSSLGEIDMMSQAATISEPGSPVELKKMKVIAIRDLKVVPQELTKSGVLKAVSVNQGEQNTDQTAFIFHITKGDESKTVYLWDRHDDKAAVGSCMIDGSKVEISYGSLSITLPFAIRLNDFILERYPGSSSPSGYKSDVVLIDKTDNVEKPFMIFMNNILKYKGYRFYQSSYDQDEQGTILSVNHDRIGMLVTYTGYGLLFLFIILAMISKNTMFKNVNPGYWNSNIRKTLPLFLILLFLSGASNANAQKLIPDKSVAEEFGKVLIQDQKGRTKPLFTLSNDILRKVTRDNSFQGLSSMQVFLGLYLDFDNWKDVPMIKVSNKDIQIKLGIRGDYASFSDVVNLADNGTYKISAEVNNAYAKSPGERNKVDKELMKVDERVNIVYMIYNGAFLKLFPLKDGSTAWGSSSEALAYAVSKEDSAYLKGIVPLYTDALQTNNIAGTRRTVGSVTEYQERFAGYELPAKAKTNAEILYYKMGIFEKLFPFYATIGLIMLIGLISMVIRGKKEATTFVKILGIILFAGFLFHTLGYGLRWYIAGRSPMSNGYESMIFISWITVLAGFIFSRKSAFALSATAVLASMTLMVAHLSFMDPEITNLVPVLKSYWLTIHVSVITGSYGFLGLGAILGLITMILLALSNTKNSERISKTIDELTVINFKTLTLGLYFLTIGTFLGAVWANESWGRYWGWDPKETWSLITIILYSIVVHSRNIPGMKDIFTFNILSLFAFSSVLMTYFGVNYYLSGLHSYASGDPIPVPTFVYVTIIILAALSFVANSKYNRFKK